jgi:cation diffusion facilitator CzcD-associated flavoprotein CzcO
MMEASRATISGLAELERRVAFELDCLGYPARPWVLSRSRDGRDVQDVIIVGGGQSGISIAFRLLRERVTRLLVLDLNQPGLEGPWLSFARMHRLRTPKSVTGPELGLPSLSVRAWWQARFGEASWQGLDKIPREHWQAYLLWVRQTAGIDVSSQTCVTDIEPLADGLLAVHARVGDGARTWLARNVVLATGIEGCGRWMVPAMISQALPRHAYAHTSEPIDFAKLRGKRIAVIGAGASAFDNAAMALEHGADKVDLFVRRSRLPTVNPNRWMEFAGFLRHFGDLDDDHKWRFMKLIFDMNQPPPRDTFDRCASHLAFRIHLGSPPERVAFADGTIELGTVRGSQRFDFLIAGTGFVVDLAARPELSRFQHQIARWSDRYQPPDGLQHAQLGSYPYLSSHFQFTERTKGSAPYLANLFSYSFAAMPSLACSAGISALKFGLDRIAAGITRGLFLDDAEAHLDALREYDEPELDQAAIDRAVVRRDGA